MKVRPVDWGNSRDALLAVRHAVFVVEQGVDASLEIDEWDAISRHFLAEDENGTPIGTARLLPEGRIGRVAVLDSWRRCGVGRALMLAAIVAARGAGMKRLRLHAQVHSIPFYESLGFVPEGGVFDEAGIPHREMCRDLCESP